MAWGDLLLLAHTKGVTVKALVERVYAENENNLSATARALKVKPNAIRYWLEKNESKTREPEAG